MNNPVRLDLENGIAVVTIDNPPVNALSHAVRAGLLRMIDTAEAGGAQAIVLIGAGRDFIAGADISEFGSPPKEPYLPDLCRRIEKSSCPVIAVLHGATLGGGLEVALSAHYRVATQTARIGLPEVLLGIIPGAGGTQRLPRLTGAEAALDLITTGRHVTAKTALELGIVDHLANAPPKEAGLAFAENIKGQGQRPTSDLPQPDAADFDAWYSRMEQVHRGQSAPKTAVRAIEAASSLPFEEGLLRERDLFLTLMDSPQRAGLIHAFFAERAVSKLPELKETNPRDIHTIGILGGGTMGAGIAAACLLKSLPVTLVDRTRAAADAARERIAQSIQGAVKRGKLEDAAPVMDQLVTTAEDLDLADADLIIEAVFEDMETKHEVFARLDAICKPGAILATNTSYLDINVIAARTSRPEDVIGLHFFSPAHIMKLLEIVVADKTAPDVIATGFSFAKRLGKTAVRAGVCDGFIGNRILSRYRMAMDNLVLDGASPYQIDNALTEFGMAMGPFAVADLAGLDIAWAARKRKAASRTPYERIPTFADRLCEMGRFGRKTGQGFYLYSEKAPQGIPDPEVEAIIAEERAKADIIPRDFRDDEIVLRFMLAIVNEAAYILDDGIARRPLDIDVTLVYGYGFPRWRGGPMHWADQAGLGRLLDSLHTLQDEDPHFWAIAPLLSRLAQSDQSFADLNKGMSR
ncbi:3-hydroxyacyl-CoA dehydrogenase NAD-binding domain-containing protein [Aestuariibius insulae]|uniref:3-hydroxyacyl-CoA dehydrogenase NAD-binding domain-containing protein n=1 Tax=Aestuariibius insulae TaxID=2058287 RepID=UPI00345E0B6A